MGYGKRKTTKLKHISNERNKKSNNNKKQKTYEKK